MRIGTGFCRNSRRRMSSARSLSKPPRLRRKSTRPSLQRITSCPARYAIEVFGSCSTQLHAASSAAQVDQQIESGEYFLSEKQKEVKKKKEKMAAAAEKAEQRRKEKEREYQAPKVRNNWPLGL